MLCEEYGKTPYVDAIAIRGVLAYLLVDCLRCGSVAVLPLKYLVLGYDPLGRILIARYGKCCAHP